MGMGRSVKVAGLACLVAFVAGCGGGGTDAKPAFRSMKIEPSTVRLGLSGINTFTAVVDGGKQSVRWQVVDASAGTIDKEGKYAAPRKSGTYKVRAEVAGDPSKFAEATVIVESNYDVQITNSGPLNIGTDGTLTMTSRVAGATDQRVTWSATGATISATGVLTAPATVGTCTVTATSVDDPAKSKTVTVNIVRPVEISSPSTLPLSIPRSKLTFGAKVVGVNSTNVDWSATAGTINASGEWTAPDSTGTVTITATNKADTSKTASVNVQVVANVQVRYVVEGKGEFVLSLRPDKAPNTCANFVTLVNRGFYDEIIMHRYEPGFVIQWGDPLTKTLPLTDPSIGTGGPGYTIPFEANDLLHGRHVLAMARATGLDTAGSQVYITLAPQPSLDGNYVVFGDVASGGDVVDALRRGDKILTARVQAVP